MQITNPVVDPKAAVPAVLYRSVFVDTPTGIEAEQTDWKKANAEVGQFKRGHVDILKWEAQSGAGNNNPVANKPAGTGSAAPAAAQHGAKP